MAFKSGDRFKCPEPSCGCEIEVTKRAGELQRQRAAALLLRP